MLSKTTPQGCLEDTRVTRLRREAGRVCVRVDRLNQLGAAIGDPFDPHRGATRALRTQYAPTGSRCTTCALSASTGSSTIRWKAPSATPASDVDSATLVALSVNVCPGALRVAPFVGLVADASGPLTSGTDALVMDRSTTYRTRLRGPSRLGPK